MAIPYNTPYVLGPEKTPGDSVPEVTQMLGSYSHGHSEPLRVGTSRRGCRVSAFPVTTVVNRIKVLKPFSVMSGNFLNQHDRVLKSRPKIYSKVSNRVFLGLLLIL